LVEEEKAETEDLEEIDLVVKEGSLVPDLKERAL